VGSTFVIKSEAGPCAVTVVLNEDGTRTVAFGRSFSIGRVSAADAEALATLLAGDRVVRDSYSDEGRRCSRCAPEDPRCGQCGGPMEQHPSGREPGFQDWECPDCEELEEECPVCGLVGCDDPTCDGDPGDC